MELKKGEVIEGYRVLTELGRGAASAIYLAQEVRTKQIWALKHVVKNSQKDQRFLDQAEAEARVGQQLDHPGIRRVIKSVKHGSFLSTKGLILIMELVDGVSLERSPPKTFEQAVSVFYQVAEALQHMHERGFVHADMKPNNIMVDDDGRVKVIDLGQSCKIGTIKPRIQGTPDYIAPEQVHRRAITPKTDIFNVGAALYWVLTRQHIPTALAKGDSLVSSLDDNMIEKAKPVVDINPRVHPKLNELVMACIEVNPDNRPESMTYVAERLNLVHGILLAQQRGQESPAPAEFDDEESGVA